MSALWRLLLAFALCVSGGLVIWGQQLRITLAEQTAQQAISNAVVAREEAYRHFQAIETLSSALNQERNQQVLLRKRQDRLRQQLSAREQQIEVLKNDNVLLREWSALALPEPARRLRERSTLVGADAYDQWLSSRRTLHPVIKSAAD